MVSKGMAELSLEAFEGLDLASARRLIPPWLGAFVAGPPEHASVSERAAAAVLDGLSDDQISDALHRLATTGADYGFYTADPAARALIRAYMGSIAAQSSVVGVERLRSAMERGPVLLLCNHLAYCDTVFKDLALVRAGAPDLAERLIAIAGPKVYDTPFRRMASLVIGTIKTAQSTAIAHSTSDLSPRQVAEIAVGTVRLAQEKMREGGLVVLYGEGSRSRDQRFGSFIKAIRKYAKFEGAHIVPLALSNTDKLMPVGQHQMHHGFASMQIGEGISVDDLGPMPAISRAWAQIADMLPDHHKPHANVSCWG